MGPQIAPDRSDALNAVADMLKVMTVVGTRPEAIKMAPVICRLNERQDEFQSFVCSTGQHREMLDQVFGVFGIEADVDLRLMRPQQSLGSLTAALFEKLEPVFQSATPDWVLAQGDTTTVFVAAMLAFYHGINFGHVEAGLRTGDKRHPFPEEVNRRLADVISDAYFAPTERARRSLLAEGCDPASVHVTGNTVIDALLEVSERSYQWDRSPLATIPCDRRLVLVTAHRRESFGETFRGLCSTIRELAATYADSGVHFVFPVHLNPNVRKPVKEVLGNVRNITLLEPLDYVSLVHLMKRCALILTDSGGIQEEAPSLRVPVLVLRDTTERPEGVAAGVARLVGTEHDRILTEASRILNDSDAHAQMATGVNPYGDGRASERIVEALLKHKRY